MNNLLAINNLTVAFENAGGDLTAVKGVSLSLDENETLALVGESGCGKTVLCKSMLQILCEKGRIRQGEILLCGRDLVEAGEAQMQKCRGGEIAMVFQDPMMSLDPAFSVGEQIAEVLRIHKGLSKKDAKCRAIELMRMVKIPDAEKRYDQHPGQFSGGMRQRIAIAVALAGEPKLLLADEPTTALDEESQKAILKLLKQIQRETGVAILFITHDLSLVEDVADRVAIMQDGVIVEEGTVADVFAASSHAYTRKLLGFLDYRKGRGHKHRGWSGAHIGSGQERPEKGGLAARNLAGESADSGRAAAGDSVARALAVDGGEVDGDLSASGGATAEHEDAFSPARQEKPLLSVQHLCKSFTVGKANRHTVLDDFNLDIYRGEIVGLVGRSGCGKSTLARCIMGIEPFESGIIETGKLNIQMIFQDSQSAFNDRMTVGEIISEPLRIAAGKRRWAGRKVRRVFGKPDGADAGKDIKAQIREAASKAMRDVGLPADMANRRPYELSGGQRQRTAIARALITKPDFIIADEPLTGLDVSAQAQIVHLFQELAVQNNLTVLFIAHDLPMVNHISDRVIRMG